MTRRARGGAQPLLPIQTVHLVHDPVHVESEFRTVRVELFGEPHHGVDVLADLGAWRDIEAEAGQPLPGLRHRVAKRLGSLAPAMDEEPEVAFGRDHRIDLPNGPGRGIARIHERALAGRQLLGVQTVKGLDRKVHLTAYFKAGGRAALQPLWHGGDRP